MSTVDIYLTRHGETEYNVNHITQGWADSPLTENGRSDARKHGQALKEKGIIFDAAATSGSGRANDTARIILKEMGQEDLAIHSDPRLREWSFGMFEGKNFRNVWEEKFSYADYASLNESMAEQDYLKKFATKLHEVDESSLTESFEFINQRLRAGLIDSATQLSQNGGGKLLIISHGLSIATLLENLSKMTWGTVIVNLGTSRISFNPEANLKLETLNERYF